jgi:hypothetical protein
MDPQTNKPKSLGQAIDELISALSSLEQSERSTAIRAACDHLGVRLDDVLPRHRGGPSSTPEPERQSAAVSTSSPVAPSASLDIRRLKDQKQPSSGIEMTALVAFYLTELAPEAERKAEIGVEDIKKYFKQANFPLPKRPEFTLVNAKNAGYFESAGGGKYKLNTVGYNLVAHNLPRGQVSGAGRSVAPKRRSTKGKTASKKKSSITPKK